MCYDVYWSMEQQMTGRKKAVNATTKTQLNFGLLLRILECCCLAFHRAIDFFALCYYECYARRRRTKFSASKSSKSRKHADGLTTVGTQTFGRLHQNLPLAGKSEKGPQRQSRSSGAYCYSRWRERVIKLMFGLMIV